MFTSVKIYRRQHGAILAETAVVLPLFALLLLMAADVTKAFVDHNTLAKAVRNGARHAASKAILGTTGVVLLQPQLVTETKNLVVYGNVSGAGTPVVSGLMTNDVLVLDVGDNNIAVNVTYDNTGILGAILPGFGFGADISLYRTLSATVTMQAL